MLLCLPSNIESSGTRNLMNLNTKLCLDEVNLVLECLTDCGLKMPGLLTPLSNDAAVISIVDPTINYLMLDSDCKFFSSISLKNLNQEYPNELHNYKAGIKDYSNNTETGNLNVVEVKPFLMECLEPWFQPKVDAFGVLDYAESFSNSSSSKLKMESYWTLLKQSVKNGKKLNEKLAKSHLSNDVGSSSGVNDTANVADSETQNTEEDLEELSHEELLLSIKDIYNSAVESSGNIVTSAKRIVNKMVNYCTKQSNESFKDDLYSMFKDNLLMTAKRISEKYEADDSQEATEQKIKECQIQVLLILGIENVRNCPDRANCVNTVTSLLRIMIFYSGVEELGNFLHDVVKESFSDNLYDILVEIGDELNISIFGDAEFANSPADTLSSELNMDEEEIFSSVISSVLSEKSTSSSCSHIGIKDNKDLNKIERKLIRHRSDLSDSSRSRQVVLPRSSQKKKKGKTAANKAIRCSPRIAAKRNEPSTTKESRVRRNLFSEDKSNHTPKKNSQPSTPKSKKNHYVLKTKYVAKTPSYKQNRSTFQRRKSFIDQLLVSPKVIAESPTIKETSKDSISKELIEKLQNASKEALMTRKIVSEEKLSSEDIKEYTPESKRRLSLKLFTSKFLSSPTARMGIKKCTKRLFDQISPQKTPESNKRHKQNENKELITKSVENET